MIRKKRGKKGEMSTQQIVILIILIISFIVILFFIFRLNLGKQSDSDICHNSVVTRGSGVVPKESIPLNCKTAYVCLTKDGTCESMTNPEIKKVKDETETYSVLAEEMATCWWMFGEGKLNYLSQDLLAQNLYCSICNQIAFDNSMNDLFSGGNIDKNNLYNYLSTTKMPDSDKNYLDYLSGVNAQEIRATLQSSKTDFGVINLGKQYFIVMGEVSDVSVLKWIGAGVLAGAGVAAIILTAGAATPAVVAIGTGAAAGGTGGYFIGTTIKSGSSTYMTPVIIEANSKDYESLGCKNIKTVA